MLMIGSTALLHTIHFVWTETSKRRYTLSQNTFVGMLSTSIGRKAKPWRVGCTLGPHASKHYTKRLHEGKLPTEASAHFLVVVRQYKHFGGILTADGNVYDVSLLL